MNKNIQIGLLLLLPTFLVAQGGIINNGAKIVIMASTEVKVDDAGVENKGAGLISNGGNIYLDQDWTQTGTASYSGMGWMWFEGAVNQNVSSVSALTVPKLRVDNGQRLILGSDVTVSTSVDLMNNGSIELGNNNLTASPGSSIFNYDASSFIVTNGTGSLKQEVATTGVVFPVGNSSYNPATLTNAGTSDNLSIRVMDQAFFLGTSGAPITSDIVDRTWMIEEEVIGGSDMTVLLQWNAAEELPGFNFTASGVAHHISGSLWDNPPSYISATFAGSARTQSRSGFTSFSPFIVRGQNTLLPVELLNFDARRISKAEVDLDWSTASEINNHGFEVERMLDNETAFSKIAWAEGNGTTANTSFYNLEDANGYSGTSYYRLKQIDVDGTERYSDIKAVEGFGEGTAIIEVFPNPVNDFINIRLSSDAQRATIQIFDAKGVLLISQRHTITNSETIQVNNLSQLADGVYMINVTTENGEAYFRKFVKE
jgi:hypothetical protein